MLYRDYFNKKTIGKLSREESEFLLTKWLKPEGEREREESSQEGGEKCKGDLAPTVISKSRRLWSVVDFYRMYVRDANP